MSQSQQSQALSYFDAVADEWRQKAEGNVPAVNVIEQRNRCAIRVARELGTPLRRFIDMGCGTGELTLDIAREHPDASATGVDFAPEMIAACESKRNKLSVANASFITQSILEFETPEGSVDLIGAMGLIEYISPAQTREFVDRCARQLRPGGALTVGSRNRLFNVFSLSSYTAMERELGTIDELLAESLAIAGASTAADAITAAATVQRGSLPQPASHPRTGIGVNIRFQYTPGELITLLHEFGLQTRTLFPVHYHALPVPAAQAMPAVHVKIAEALYETAPLEHRLLPFASSFVIEARRRA